jgi:hypothetical protein
VSYRRLPDDTAFVDRLQEALSVRGKRLWVDRADIEPAADSWARIARGIRAARAFIFVITPESVVSEQCLRELDAAGSLNKLIIPVALRHTDQRGVDERLRAPNWIFFPPDLDFGKSLGLLLTALDDDLEWRDDHARLAVRADEWDHSEPKRDRSFLLRGLELRSARDWLAHAAEHEKVPPTKPQVEYILASRKAAIRTRRTEVIALITVLAVVLGFVTYGVTQGRQASRQTDAAASRQLINESETLGDASPVISKLESIAAWAINPSSNARYAMLAAAARPGIAVLAGHGSPVQAIAFSPDGTLLATGGYDGTVRLWDLATRRPIASPVIRDMPTLPIESVAFSPDGTTLAIGGYRTLRLWDAARQRLISDLPIHPGDAILAVAFGQDGKTLDTSGIDGTVQAWDNATGRPAGGGPLTGGTGEVLRAAFSGDLRTLATSSITLTRTAVKQDVELWDVTSRQRIGVLPAGPVDALGVQPGRQDPGHGRLRRHGAAVGCGYRPARGQHARWPERTG